MNERVVTVAERLQVPAMAQWQANGTWAMKITRFPMRGFRSILFFDGSASHYHDRLCCINRKFRRVQ